VKASREGANNATQIIVIGEGKNTEIRNGMVNVAAVMVVLRREDAGRLLNILIPILNQKLKDE